MADAYVLGIDAGTGSCWAIIFNTRGKEIGSAQLRSFPGEIG